MTSRARGFQLQQFDGSRALKGHLLGVWLLRYSRVHSCHTLNSAERQLEQMAELLTAGVEWFPAGQGPEHHQLENGRLQPVLGSPGPRRVLRITVQEL